MHCRLNVRDSHIRRFCISFIKIKIRIKGRIRNDESHVSYTIINSDSSQIPVVRTLSSRKKQIRRQLEAGLFLHILGKNFQNLNRAYRLLLNRTNRYFTVVHCQSLRDPVDLRRVYCIFSVPMSGPDDPEG